MARQQPSTRFLLCWGRLVGVFFFFAGAELGPIVACMLSEEASKQTSLCWGVLGVFAVWVNVGWVRWGLWCLACQVSEQLSTFCLLLRAFLFACSVPLLQML